MNEYVLPGVVVVNVADEIATLVGTDHTNQNLRRRHWTIVECDARAL